MRPTLRQLQYLVAVAESGRFRDAAKQVHITQPGLSSQIAAMEDVLGATLFERTATGAILTPRGTEVYRRAKCILRDVEELKAFTRHEAAKLDGHFRLGVLPVVGPYLLPMASTSHGRSPTSYHISQSEILCARGNRRETRHSPE